MSIRLATLLLVGCLVVSGSANADWLVLRGGKKIETAGQWTQQGVLLTVHEATGRPKSLMLSIVDFDATLRANSGAGKPPASGWHITAEAIKKMQQITRQQEAMAAQMRARQKSGAEMDAMAGKVDRSDWAYQGQFRAGATPQPGSTSQGMQAIANCALVQDNVAAYNACLNANGH
jgi:hypothetical protein